MFCFEKVPLINGGSVHLFLRSSFRDERNKSEMNETNTDACSVHLFLRSSFRDERNKKRWTVFQIKFANFSKVWSFVHLFLRSSFGDTTPFLGKTLPYIFVFLNSTFSKSTASTYPSPKPNPNPCPVRSRRFSPCSSNNVKDERNKRKMNQTKKDELFLCFIVWTKMNEEKDERNP